MATQNNGALTGTNAWVNLVLLIGSAFGMTQDTATIATTAVIGLIGAVFAVRTWIVNAKYNKGWISDPNTWSYLSAAVLGLFPAGANLVPSLHDLVNAIISKDWPKIVTASLALLTLIYYTFIKKSVK